MSAWDKLPQIGKVEVLSHQKAPACLGSGPDVRIAMSGETFF